jgi:hypothetical protein
MNWEDNILMSKSFENSSFTTGGSIKSLGTIEAFKEYGSLEE